MLDGFKPNATNVEEFVRETLGEDTCDARRSVSDPNESPEDAPQSPCSFDKGLASTYPQYKYRVHDPRVDADRGFGLLGDSDHLWTKNKRERQKHQVGGRLGRVVLAHAGVLVVWLLVQSSCALTHRLWSRAGWWQCANPGAVHPLQP